MNENEENGCVVASHDDGITLLLWSTTVWIGGTTAGYGLDGNWFSMVCGIVMFLFLLGKAVRTSPGSRVIKAPRCSCRKHAARAAKRGRDA